MRWDLSVTEVARFWSKVDRSGGPDACWPWTAGLFDKGYGAFAVDRMNRSAHRVAYILTVGFVPEGLQLDHLCHSPEWCTAAALCLHRRCVNPRHLKPSTARVNTLRSDALTAKNAKKTHCPKGHPLFGDNLYAHAGRRHCRACRAETDRQIKARRRALRAATSDADLDLIAEAVTR